LAPFVGRDAEVAELSRLVDEARWVTLVGAPGCGKTRLAIELGAAWEATFGVWFVELAPVADPALVPGAVAGGLGVGAASGRPLADIVVEALGEAGPCLLVVDNCEHVVEAAAGLIERVVASCPSVRILATSRVGLGGSGERVWEVPSLSPGPAAELFVDRARYRARGFEVDATGARTVEEICRRLDCLPLAIELVAAWTRVLSPGEILDRLGRPSPFLTGGPGDGDPRHETMAAAVAWSHQLLPPAARDLFDRLSVFAGTFDLEAVEAVAGAPTDVLGALAVLVDHSLVLTDASTNGPMRYRLLEPVRQCAEAALADRGETDALRRLHAEHYMALARFCDPFAMHGVAPTFPLARLEPEEANLLVAVTWARSQPPDLALRLCEAFSPLWEFRGPLREGRAWLAEALAAGTPDVELRVAALTRLGKLAWRQGAYDQARARLEEARSVALEAGRRWRAANVLSLMGLVEWSAGDIEAAVRLCYECDAVIGSEDGDSGFPMRQVILGWASYADGDVATGDAHMKASLDANRAAGNPTADAHALWGLTYGAFLADDPVAQRKHALAALAAVRQAGGYFEGSDWVAMGAILAAQERRWHSALRLAGAMYALRKRDGSQAPPQMTERTHALFERVVVAVGGQAAAAELVAEGSQMTMDAVVAEMVAEPTDDPSELLSRREREVARLVARGLTNVEIARDLSISRRTVESHVEHIRYKLGLGSRQQLMAWALHENP
jgi:predicted ATPase/DNA-binding CsgD family transcriptional regulator